MPANVDVLIPNDRAREALGAIRSNIVDRFWLLVGDQFRRDADEGMAGGGIISSRFGYGKSALLVALLADLDRAQGRRELENLCNRVKGDVPVVLMSGEATPRSEAAFQALTHVTWLAGREVYIAPDVKAVARMLFARQAQAEAKLIASAAVEDGNLIVWSCEPRRYSVPASEIPSLAKMTPVALAELDVSETGSHIHWEDGDVDLDLDVIRAYADPGVRRQHEDERRKEAARYARAIRKLREERGLKQAYIAGLSERQVRRLEGGATLPHSSTLKKLAAAHEMSVEDYLKELAKRSRRPAQGSRPRKTRLSRRRAAKHG
jgi:ribosome-binding protein aMBF1 (putative translation factor)